MNSNSTTIKAASNLLILFLLNSTTTWVLSPDVFVQSCLPTKLLSTILTNQKNPVVSAVNVLIEDANTFKSFLADLALVPGLVKRLYVHPQVVKGLKFLAAFVASVVLVRLLFSAFPVGRMRIRCLRVAQTITHVLFLGD